MVRLRTLRGHPKLLPLLHLESPGLRPFWVQIPAPACVAAQRLTRTAGDLPFGSPAVVLWRSQDAGAANATIQQGLGRSGAACREHVRVVLAHYCPPSDRPHLGRMVTFADTYTPRELRVKRAVGEMRDRLGPRPPTPALLRTSWARRGSGRGCRESAGSSRPISTMRTRLTSGIAS
jgi:hypothetical protein